LWLRSTGSSSLANVDPGQCQLRPGRLAGPGPEPRRADRSPRSARNRSQSGALAAANNLGAGAAILPTAPIVRMVRGSPRLMGLQRIGRRDSRCGARSAGNGRPARRQPATPALRFRAARQGRAGGARRQTQRWPRRCRVVCGGWRRLRPGCRPRLAIDKSNILWRQCVSSMSGDIAVQALRALIAFA